MISLLLLQGCGGFDAREGTGIPIGVTADYFSASGDTSSDEQLVCEAENLFDFCLGGWIEQQLPEGCFEQLCLAQTGQEADPGTDPDPSQNPGSDPAPTQTQPVAELTGDVYFAAAAKRSDGSRWSWIASGGRKSFTGTAMTRSQAEDYCDQNSRKSTTSTGISLSSSERARICVFVTSEGDMQVIDYKSGLARALQAIGSVNGIPTQVAYELYQRETHQYGRIPQRVHHSEANLEAWASGSNFPFRPHQ